MSKTKLVGADAGENAIVAYIEAYASEDLIEKINAGEKTIATFMKYAQEQARKHQKNGCAMIEDKVVFGWAMHYFEEDSIPVEAKKEKAKAKAKTEDALDDEETIEEDVFVRAARKNDGKGKKKPKVEFDQISIFDFFGGEK